MESSGSTLRVELLEKIGEGGFGKVHIARLLDESTVASGVPRYIAIKIEHSEGNALEFEFNVMALIEKHPNLIEYIEYSPDFSLLSSGKF